MIRITIEMVPSGYEPAAHKIGEIELVNTADHEKRPEWGNYVARIMLNGEKKEVRVLNHRRDLGILPLLSRVCSS